MARRAAAGSAGPEGSSCCLCRVSRSQRCTGRMPESFASLDQFGFVIKGVNPSINDRIGSSSYYLDVVQTRDHIREHWGRHFEVLEFVDSLAANQDLV